MDYMPRFNREVLSSTFALLLVFLEAFGKEKSNLGDLTNLLHLGHLIA
jgi:hypothetical protein